MLAKNLLHQRDCEDASPPLVSTYRAGRLAPIEDGMLKVALS
jgi:hypothetical protein